MSSPVDICNIALAHLGDRRITRLDDDAALSDGLVGLCAEFYPQARTEALAAHRWSFAKTSAALSRRTDITTLGYTYAHQKPEDCLRVMRLVEGSELKDPEGVVTEITYGSRSIDKFKIVGGQIWSDYKYLALEYVKDLTNPSDWSPHFRAAVARLLAAYLAGPTTDDPNEVSNQMRIYETVALTNAQYYDSVQDGSGENSDMETRLAGSPSLRSRHNFQYGRTDPSDTSYIY